MAPSLDCCIKASYHGGKPTGHETTLANRSAYITGSVTADKAILILADVFGYSFVNSQVLADKYAQGASARVYLVDFFDGRDLNLAMKKDPKADRSTLVKGLLADFPPRDWNVFPPVVEAIRKAQPSAKKIGAIGFCWGATGALFLGSKQAGSAQVDAVAFAHPSALQPEDFEMNESPGLFMMCEKDPQVPKEKRDQCEEVLNKLAKDAGRFSRISYYPFVSHGWAIKGDETDPYAAKAMNYAAAEAITFFSLELAS